MSFKSLYRLAAWSLLCVTVFTLGCSKKTKEPMPVLTDHGPHGGHTFKMPQNSSFVLEFTQDAEHRRIVIYVHHAGSQHPFPLATKQLKGKIFSGSTSFDANFNAYPRTGDPAGQSSRFVLGFDSIPQQLLESNEFVIKVWYSYDGETVSVSMTHFNDHVHTYHHD